MSLMDHLRALESAYAPPQLLGKSMVVLYTPEAATGESLAVGVVVRPAHGQPESRWLRTFDRIRCAFGEDVVVHLPLLLKIAEKQIQAGGALEVPLFRCTQPEPVYGSNLTEAVEGLFARFVPLAKPHAEPNRRAPASSVRNAKLRKTVFTLLKQRHGAIADSIIAGNPELRFRNPNIRTVLHVPLQGINRCAGRYGTIVSAQTSRPEKLALNIHPAVAELNTAAELYDIPERGLFILRPREGSMPDDQYERVDGALNDLMKIFEAQGITVNAELSESHISDAVSEWSLKPPSPAGSSKLLVQNVLSKRQPGASRKSA